jgi:hypothetical protein
VKQIILDAYEQGRMLAVLSFVRMLLEPAMGSRVFRPPNPWLTAILGLLVEIYNLDNIKTGLKFEVSACGVGEQRGGCLSSLVGCPTGGQQCGLGCSRVGGSCAVQAWPSRQMTGLLDRRRRCAVPPAPLPQCRPLSLSLHAADFMPTACVPVRVCAG